MHDFIGWPRAALLNAHEDEVVEDARAQMTNDARPASRYSFALQTSPFAPGCGHRTSLRHGQFARVKVAFDDEVGVGGDFTVLDLAFDEFDGSQPGASKANSYPKKTEKRCFPSTHASPNSPAMNPDQKQFFVSARRVKYLSRHSYQIRSGLARQTSRDRLTFRHPGP